MTREELRKWSLRHPFIPFVIVTRSGARYRIPDYGCILARPQSIYIKTAGAPWEFDLPLSEIVSCEEIRRRPAKRRRRRRA